LSLDTLDERPALPALSLLVGGAILTLLFLTLAIVELGWLLGFPLHRLVLPIAFAGSCLATGWGARRYFRRPWRAALIVAAFLAALVAASAWIGATFYDVSFDGQAYQQEGVYQLAHGWNPFRTPYITPISIDQNVKLIHYPKGPWMIGAAMYSLTGRIETGKFANLLLVVAAFCTALAFFSGALKMSGLWPVVMAALAAINPVALCQILTFYVDGQMASLLVCLAVLCFLSVVRSNPWHTVWMFEATILLIQVKFTGVVFATMFFAGFLALLAWQRRLTRNHVYAAVLALGLGTCVFGRNPYVSNFLENGHPFYPFFGRGDFPRISMASSTPPEFLQRNRAVNLGASIFSRSCDWPPQSTLKAPWQVRGGEWTAFTEPDVLTGGFGPLFPAALVLSLGVLVIGVWQGGPARWTTVAVILIIIGSVLPVSACWWARYAPQIWLVPLLALLPFGEKVQAAKLHRISWLVLFILGINVAGIGFVNFRANRNATRETGEILDDLRSHAPFRAAFGNFRSNRFRLQEAGIPFVEDELTLRCDAEVKENDDLCIEPQALSK